MCKDKTGKVYLVGAGPGDPGLLTAKARLCLEDADVVIYDHLANPTILNHMKESTEKIYVGKQAKAHTLSQEGINELLVEKAKAGKTIVRLKGGDPFIFGRGGEEAQFLTSHNIDFEIVPGVTSAIAVPAYAGIPLTHRKYASTVSFVTGHEDPTKTESRIHWDALAESSETIVFLMGLKNLPNIVAHLIEAGKFPETPVAVIRWGTLPTQKTVTGVLADIVGKVKEAGLTPPAIIVVGEVINLRRELSWFEQKPLFGKSIVITRARAQASMMALKFSRLGAEVVEFPTISIAPPLSWEKADLAITNIEKYGCLVFTSVNGVTYFFMRMLHLNKDTRDLKGIKLCAIGEKTAQGIKEKGIRVDLVPHEYKGEELAKGIINLCPRGDKILIARAAEARDVLPEMLKDNGFEVDVIPFYQTIKECSFDKNLLDRIRKGYMDIVTFTSSSTVHNFVDIVGKDTLPLPDKVLVACIGPITSQTAASYGIRTDIMPKNYTIDALIDAIIKHVS